jgi:hypothetical protein
MDDDDELNYILNVIAFTGIKLGCVLINEVQKTIKFSKRTGKLIKHRALIKRTEKFTRKGLIFFISFRQCPLPRMLYLNSSRKAKIV